MARTPQPQRRRFSWYPITLIILVLAAAGITVIAAPRIMRDARMTDVEVRTRFAAGFAGQPTLVTKRGEVFKVPEGSRSLYYVGLETRRDGHRTYNEIYFSTKPALEPGIQVYNTPLRGFSAPHGTIAMYKYHIHVLRADENAVHYVIEAKVN